MYLLYKCDNSCSTGKVLYWQSSYDGESLYKCEIPKTGEKPKVVRIEELYQVRFS